MKKPGLGSPIEKFTRMMFTQIIQGVSAFLAENSFSISEVAALHLIASAEGLSIQALSKKLNLSVSATSRLVSGLVKKGLLTRRADPRDARAKIVTCSAKGSELLDEMSLARVAAIFDVVQTLPPEIPRRIMGAIDLYGKG